MFDQPIVTGDMHYPEKTIAKMHVAGMYIYTCCLRRAGWYLSAWKILYIYTYL